MNQSVYSVHVQAPILDLVSTYTSLVSLVSTCIRRLHILYTHLRPHLPHVGDGGRSSAVADGCRRRPRRRSRRLCRHRRRHGHAVGGPRRRLRQDALERALLGHLSSPHQEGRHPTSIYCFLMFLSCFLVVGFCWFDWLWCRVLEKNWVFGLTILESLSLATFLFCRWQKL